MSELAAFVLARIADDEATARAATPGPWKVYHSRHDFRDGSFCEAWGVENSDDKRAVEISFDRDYYTPEGACEREEDAAHIARHDPARVLAECEAKRRIVALAEDAFSHTSTDLPKDYMRASLRLLAQPYADHPDFRDEWRLDAPERNEP